jgi:hypothetical protein
MYNMAQPTVDFNELVKRVNNKEEEKDAYSHYYLSQENYKYIVNMFLDAYNIRSNWDNHVENVINYLKNGGLIDKYIPGENGYPGYRGYDKTPKLETLIGKENADKALDLINKCKEFYTLNRMENTFRFTIMDFSPTSNKQTVINYWKSKGVDIKIKDFDIEDIYFGDNELNTIDDD